MAKTKEEKALYLKEWKLRNKPKMREWSRKWKLNNPEKVAARHERYRLRNPEKIKESKRRWREKNHDKIKIYHKLYRHNPKHRFLKYRRSAKKRGHVFDLSFETFQNLLSTRKCHYCGFVGKVGLDRVINNLGYLVDNVVPCCWPCNRTKGKLNGPTYVSLCLAVAKNNNNF